MERVFVGEAHSVWRGMIGTMICLLGLRTPGYVHRAADSGPGAVGSQLQLTDYYLTDYYLIDYYLTDYYSADLVGYTWSDTLGRVNSCRGGP